MDDVSLRGQLSCWGRQTGDNGVQIPIAVNTRQQAVFRLWQVRLDWRISLAKTDQKYQKKNGTEDQKMPRTSHGEPTTSTPNVRSTPTTTIDGSRGWTRERVWTVEAEQCQETEKGHAATACVAKPHEKRSTETESHAGTTANVA